jgi:nicotinamide-nucleotide amidase
MEMQAMLREYVLPRLASLFPAPGRRYAAFRTSGLAESDLAQRLAEIVGRYAQVRWAFYPSWQGVDVKLRQYGGTVTTWDDVRQEVRTTLGPYVYSENPDEPLEEVVRRLLVERSLTLAVAESCTGGLVGTRLTDAAGASEYFAGGFVTYSNAMKTAWLGVPEALLREQGAVSARVAAAMARGARERAGTALGLAVTGIAGPTGGTPQKPVGLVFLALATADGCWTRELRLGMRRDLNRQVSAQLAMDLVRRHVLGLPAGERE